MCQWIVQYTHYFPIFIHFTNQITLIKQSLAQKLRLIFKLSSIKRQINISLWTHIGCQRWRKGGKTFVRCYTITLKFCDKLIANFVLLYFSSYTSVKIWHLFLKNVEKNNEVVHLRLFFTYLHQNFFNIKKHLALALKKICSYIFLCIPN